jgi:hypothetical protein
VDAEGVAVAAHQVHPLVRADATERRAALREQHEAVVAGQVAGVGEVDHAVLVELVEVGGRHLQLGHAGVAGVADRLRAVLLGVEADGRGLDPQREVLGDQRHPVALVGQVAGHGEDPGVVVAQPEARRQRGGVGVVELDAQRAALGADRDRLVETAVDDAQVVQRPQGRACEEPELGVVALALELGDHHHREHDLVLGEAGQRAGIGEQDAGVQDVGPSVTVGGAGRCGAAG